jgi:Helicase conserved C-terminal domain
MKLFPSDWQGFFAQLVAWGELSIPARRTFLDGAAPGLSILPAAGDPTVAELRDAGLLEEPGGPGSLGISKRYVPFHQVMKSLAKYPLFESPGLAALCAYLGEHYNQQERSHLHESLALLPNDFPRIAGLVSSLEWLQTALARGGTLPQESGWETARAMLSFFTEQRDRIAVRDLEEYFPTVERDELCAAARLGLQRAVFFLGLRRADLEPMLGIWPAAARRLRRLSVVLAPGPVSVGGVFHHPFLVEDMTTLLVSACGAPIPLRRGDEKPFARFREETAAMLLSLPEWLERLTGLSMEGRIDLAFQGLRLSGLLVPSSAGPGAPLAPAPLGARWIRQPLAERHSFLVNELVGTPQRPSRLFDLMEEEVSSADGAREEILPWLMQAFSCVPLSTFIRFGEFAEYQAAIGSPLAGGSRGPGSSASSALATEEAMEELWKSFLGIFLGRCLLALGGAEAGITAEGKPGFRVTGVGRILLGLPHEGAAGQEEASSQESPALIVQPNFEVVFFSPSPGLEAALGRYCERVGREVGVLFRFTRQSLRRARAAGIDADQVLQELARGSRSPVPPNVEHEIRGWMGGGNE